MKIRYRPSVALLVLLCAVSLLLSACTPIVSPTESRDRWSRQELESIVAALIDEARAITGDGQGAWEDISSGDRWPEQRTGILRAAAPETCRAGFRRGQPGRIRIDLVHRSFPDARAAERRLRSHYETLGTIVSDLSGSGPRASSGFRIEPDGGAMLIVSAREQQLTLRAWSPCSGDPSATYPP